MGIYHIWAGNLIINMKVHPVRAHRVFAPRKIAVIEQRSFGTPVSIEHGVHLPGERPRGLPDLSPLSPPFRMSSAMSDYYRHYALFMDCFAQTDGALPVLATEKHAFSLPFYAAIKRAAGREDVLICSLDAHLDGMGIAYANWSFWGFGIYNGIIDPRKLIIVGSFQLQRAESFMADHKCEAAVREFKFENVENTADLTTSAAQRICKVVRQTADRNKLQADLRLRDFVEYAYLRNSGVRLFHSTIEENVFGMPIFVSLDTDCPKAIFLESAERLKGAALLGLHFSEFQEGVRINGPLSIEQFAQKLLPSSRFKIK